MTGPITFADYRARSHLLVVGHVYTFRGERTTGETWGRWRRGGSGKIDVDVERVEDVEEPDDLSRFADASGFEDVREWWEAIADLHGANASGWVYRVDLLGWRGEQA